MAIACLGKESENSYLQGRLGLAGFLFGHSFEVITHLAMRF
jgi:hypothetical protein